MAIPELKTDITTPALERLVSTYERAENLQAYVSIVMGQFQELEETFIGLAFERTIETAEGVFLDVYGRIVGEKRNGLLDSAYRRFLQARILTNTTDGSLNALLRIVRLITNAFTVKFTPEYPAAYSLQYGVTTSLPSARRKRVKRQILQATPCGVGTTIVEHTGEPFGFAGDPEALGFGEGEFATVI